MPDHSTPSKPEVPQIRNIDDLTSTPTAPTLVHFTEQQWRDATRGARPGRSVKAGNPYLEYTPLPDGGGIVMPYCAPGPGEECRVRPVIDPPGPRPEPVPGPGPGPDPGPESLLGAPPLRWECQCRPRRSRQPPAPVQPPCELVVERTPRLRIRCANNSCTKRCVLTLVRDGRGVRIFCACS